MRLDPVFRIPVFRTRFRRQRKPISPASETRFHPRFPKRRQLQRAWRVVERRRGAGFRPTSASTRCPAAKRLAVGWPLRAGARADTASAPSLFPDNLWGSEHEDLTRRADRNLAQRHAPRVLRTLYAAAIGLLARVLPNKRLKARGLAPRPKMLHRTRLVLSGGNGRRIEIKRDFQRPVAHRLHRATNGVRIS